MNEPVEGFDVATLCRSIQRHFGLSLEIDQVDGGGRCANLRLRVLTPEGSSRDEETAHIFVDVHFSPERRVVAFVLEMSERLHRQDFEQLLEVSNQLNAPDESIVRLSVEMAGEGGVKVLCTATLLVPQALIDGKEYLLLAPFVQDILRRLVEESFALVESVMGQASLAA